MNYNNVKVEKTKIILNKLEKSIKTKTPFSIVRFGDGTIKAIHAFLNSDYKQLKDISVQEGIPMMLFDKIINLWKTSANISDYIDTPEVYFSNKFWKRTKKINKESMSQKTTLRLRIWKDLYRTIGINNENYCNPEINFLSCIGEKTLPDILKGKKICCITSRNDLYRKLSSYFDLNIINIKGKFEQQFSKSFSKVIDCIDNDANKYDVWLVAAGELGRVYPGLIKFKGGRAFDIGSLIDLWCGEKIPSRLVPYLTKIDDSLKLKLTIEGEKYSKYI